jgi:hypothetical protein
MIKSKYTMRRTTMKEPSDEKVPLGINAFRNSGRAGVRRNQNIQLDVADDKNGRKRASSNLYRRI